MRTPIVAAALSQEDPSLQHPRTYSPPNPRLWRRRREPGRTDTGEARAARSGTEIGGVDRRKDAADSNTQSAPRLTGFSSRAATNVSRACEEEAKLRPPPRLAGKLQVSGCWDPAALPRARSVPPEVPNWRAAGARSSPAAFQSSLGTPPSVRVASAERGSPPTRRAGLQQRSGSSAVQGRRLQTLCGPAGAPGPGGAAAAPHHAARLQQALPELRAEGGAGGAAATFSSPPLAERRRAEGRGLLLTDAHLSAPCTPELRCRAEVRLPKWRWSHNCRCTEERERLEKTPPNSMLPR